MTAPETVPETTDTATRTITLQNPVRAQFASFIFGNATQCKRVAIPDSCLGQHLVICGAGPSLRETAAKWCPQGDQVWGCNSAATWLYDNKYKVTHGFTVDQTAHMLEEWVTAPPLDYLLASSCNPFLCEYLESKGREVTFFHNYVGVEGKPVAYSVCQSCEKMFDRLLPDAPQICPGCQSTEVLSHVSDYEHWLYSSLYPSTMSVGSGLNAVTRAIDLGMFMGFEKVTVLGSDCAMQASGRMPAGLVTGSPEHLAWLRTNTVFHADGGNALASEASCITLGADICVEPTCGALKCRHEKRYWLTKPDMAITALWLVWMKRQYGSRLRIMGDTLPKALLQKPDAYLNRLPVLTDTNGNPITFTMPSPDGS